MSVRVATLLLFVYVLAQTRLFFGGQLVALRCGHACWDGIGRSLGRVLLLLLLTPLNRHDGLGVGVLAWLLNRAG